MNITKFGKYLLILFLPVLFWAEPIHAQNIWEGYEQLFQPVKRTVAYQTVSAITIDGNADEESWQLAEWSEDFIDILGESVADSAFLTRYKILWDKDYLYIFAELLETDIWIHHSKADQVFGEENTFEIFLDPDNDTHDFFEFELNAQNTLSDRFMPKAKRNGGEPLWSWNIRGFRSAVTQYGTINNPEDIDEKWTVEIAIPFRSLTITDKYLAPKNGDYWKVNFARVQWQLDIVAGRYKKQASKQARSIWIWSPQYSGNMIIPEEWGIIHFSTNAVGTVQIHPAIPVAEKYGNYLWFLYYKQMAYKKQNLKYAEKLSELGLSQVWQTKTGEPFLYDMQVNGHIFTLTLKTKRGLKLAINQDGHFQVLQK